MGDAVIQAAPDQERFAAAIAGLMFANGQTTEGMRVRTAALGRACGATFQLVAAWGQLTLLSDRLPFGLIVMAAPLAIDMRRVEAAEALARQVIAGATTASQALRELGPMAMSPPVGRPP